MTQLGITATGDDDAFRRTRTDGGAREQQVFAITNNRFVLNHPDLLLNHGGFTGQNSFFNLEIVGFK
ncbi:Uncharacterised protein [Yersinia enterocolitica]|nr:Uncharacterised protein [Yersinia enterocolitica]